jgi:RNA polymerase subunit RPABC4/transcription elongation factor Spt4
MIYFQKTKGSIIATCKNCKREIEAKKRQCPYCGILNPTVTLKDIFVGLVIVLVVMSIVTYFVN